MQSKRNRGARDESRRRSQPGLNLNCYGAPAETAIWKPHAQLIAAFETVVARLGDVQDLIVLVVDPNRLGKRRTLERDFGMSS